MFNPQWFVNSRIDGFAVLEFIVPGDPKPRFVPLRTTHLSGSIIGPFADFTLIHTFRFSRDQCPYTIEALYRFSLPGDAAVTGVTVSFGQTMITATLKARVTAEKEYDDAKKEGKSAALLTRESINVFTLQIAGIAPDEDVVIKTHYVQIGDPEGIGFSYRITLTTPPRYVRGDEQSSRSSHAQPLAVLRDPGHRFGLEISAEGDATLSSPSHSLTRNEKVYRLSSGSIVPDRDCVLNWRPVQAGEAPAFQVFSDDTNHPHFLALITPPEQVGTQYPRELIILVDHSGSMSGSKWEAADRAVGNLLKGLNQGDYFNLCLFESVPYWFSDKPVPVTRSNIESALKFLGDQTSGGTELGVALEQAFRQPKYEGDLSRHVVIITDAQVTDEGRIVELVKTEHDRKYPRRCSILCIDAAPNTALASRIARYGRGVVQFLTSSPEEEDLYQALDTLVSFWTAPLAINLTLNINRDQVIVPDHTVMAHEDGWSTIDLGDLVPGKSIWIYGMCGEGHSDCEFTLSSPCGTVKGSADGQNPQVRTLFGAEIVASLDYLMNSAQSFVEIDEELRVLGHDILPRIPGDTPIYHENQVKDAREKIKDLLVKTSLSYGIASSETAFIAVRQDADRVVEESVIVANALPSGWSDGFCHPSPPKNLIMQPDGTLNMPKRRKARDMPSGGALLDWFDPGSGSSPGLSPQSTQKKSGKPFKWKGDAYVLPSRDSPEQGMITITLFKGTPVFYHDEAVLFDSDAKDMHSVIPRGFHLKKIRFSCTESRPEFVHLRLMLFIGDLVRQVIEIPLSELEARGGVVSVFAIREHGAIIKLLLMNVSGQPAPSLPEMTVIVEGEVN